jgi:hypothetical protein
MKREQWRCFAPVVGIFLGSLLGWFLHFLFKSLAEADFAVRLFMIVYGIFGWGVSTALSGKRLHCGGTLEADTATKRRYGVQGAIAFFLVLLAPLLLVSQAWFFYFPLMFVLVACFCGEVGWGKPSKIFSLSIEK